MTPEEIVERAAEVLVAHQRSGTGMTSGSPDRCRCGAELTIDEAAYLAKLTGGRSHALAGEVMANGGSVNHSIYEGLVGYVFNPYYDDGVDEYLRERP